MKQRILLGAALLALALGLSGCSVQSLLPSTTLVSATPTAVPTPLPTAAPPVDQSSTNAFDNAAGNCVDAANQAINLMSEAAAGRFGGSAFNMDMTLNLEPAGPDCAGSPARIAHYRQDVVGSATLTVWPLDSVWGNSYSAIRQQWLLDVLNALARLYPHANVAVQVHSASDGAVCGSASLTFGGGGSRRVDTSCG